MKKQAKFFCENCGEEVAQNARFCKKCGRFFSAVRCPACGKVGSAHAFVNGCPSCGYAEKQKNGKPGADGLEKPGESGFSDSAARNKKNYFYFHKKHPAKKQGSVSLPIWIYCLTFLILVVMIVLFMRCSY